MKPGQVINAIKKRFWIIAILVVVAALAAAVVSRIQSPVYKVEITLAAVAPINPVTKQPDATITLAYQTVMPTIAVACESPEIAKRVRERLVKSKIDISEEELLKKISAGAVTNTNSLRVTVTDKIPYRVKEIANAWGTVASQSLSKASVLLNGTLEFIKPATQPDKPTQPKPTVYMGLGVFLGLLIGFSLAIGVEYFNPHFRSPEETEEMLGLPVVGVIPRKNRKDALRESYAALRTGLLFSRSGNDHSSVLVAGAVPVKGVHDVAINLAKSVADTGRKTLLVDCDLRNRVVSSLMGANDLGGISDIIEREENPKGKVAVTNLPNLYLLPAGSPTDNPTDIVSRPQFQVLLEDLQKEFDMVVIDAPTSIEAVDASILSTYTKFSLVVIDIKSCPRNLALQALEIFERLNVKPTGIVLTNVKKAKAS